MGRQRDLLFPSTLVVITLLGSALVVAAWRERRDDAVDVEPAIGDHWHAAFGGYVCDSFLEPVPETTSPQGIHTHGDGLIHVEPASSAGAGDNARLGLFLDSADIDLSDDKLTFGDESRDAAEDQCDGEDGELVLARWEDAQSNEEPALIKDGFDDLRFRNDGQAYTVAFVAEGTTDIPKPPSIAELENIVEPEPEPGAADPQATTTTTPAPAPAPETTQPSVP